MPGTGTTNLRVGFVRNGGFLIVVGVAAGVTGPAVRGGGTQRLHRARLGQVDVHGKEVDGPICQHTRPAFNTHQAWELSKEKTSLKLGGSGGMPPRNFFPRYIQIYAIWGYLTA